MSSREPSGVEFFPTRSDLRRWFRENHTSAKELWVGFYKKGSGTPSITWPEAVDEALCVGWIDGIRKGLDARRYTNRFTPRKPGSVWSAINVRRAAALDAKGRMRPAGRKAFAARKANRSGIYSYEQRHSRLEPPYEGELRRNRAAWTYFEAQPPSYKQAAGWWVISAKKEETRRKRLRTLIELSARGRRIPQFTRPSRPTRVPARA